MKIIKTKKAPAAIGPYSQAIVAGDFVFCSGQIGINPTTGNLVEGIEDQTKQVITNLQAVLKAARLDLASVVKTTVFLKNINDFPKMNNVFASFFDKHKPTRSTIEASNLPKNALVEIDAIALK
ncbi:MAG: RidA family protein [Candidatus Levyibacteriota bacterium]|nr:MAG: RidA family protein [Candidatus Levybacteria bacterium]